MKILYTIGLCIGLANSIVHSQNINIEITETLNLRLVHEFARPDALPNQPRIAKQRITSLTLLDWMLESGSIFNLANKARILRRTTSTGPYSDGLSSFQYVYEDANWDIQQVPNFDLQIDSIFTYGKYDNIKENGTLREAGLLVLEIKGATAPLFNFTINGATPSIFGFRTIQVQRQPFSIPLPLAVRGAAGSTAGTLSLVSGTITTSGQRRIINN